MKMYMLYYIYRVSSCDSGVILRVKMCRKERTKFFLLKLSFSRKSSLKIYQLYLNLSNSILEKSGWSTREQFTREDKWKMWSKIFRGEKINWRQNCLNYSRTRWIFKFHFLEKTVHLAGKFYSTFFIYFRI